VELLDDGGSWQGIYRLEYCVSYIAEGMEQIDRVEAHPHHQEQPTRKKEEEKKYPQNPHCTGHGDPQEMRAYQALSTKFPINFGFTACLRPRSQSSRRGVSPVALLQQSANRLFQARTATWMCMTGSSPGTLVLDPSEGCYLCKCLR